MGLIAREIEKRGIPTLSMSSARSITLSAHPPRAVYLDYPLGRTAGKPSDPQNQFNVMKDTLAAFETISRPGEIVNLDYRWSSNDSWKDSVMRPKQSSDDKSQEDDRTPRLATPQYQFKEDEIAVDPNCPSCVFLE